MNSSAKLRISEGKTKLLFEFFRTDGAARAIMLACLAES